MRTNRIDGPVEHRRGIDPQWWECGGLSYDNLLVRAPCRAVVEVVRGDRDVPKRVGDLLAGDEGLDGPIRDELVFVYQLRGHEWSQVETWQVALGGDMADDLSRRLDTQAFFYGREDVASALYYGLLERGELIEAYSRFDGNPVYQGEEGQADLRRQVAEGWRISRDHSREFLTRRGTALDIESEEECQSLLERVVVGLGMFVACQPFWLDPKLGRVVRGRGWAPEHFAAAKVLYCTEADRRPRGEEDDPKLVL